MSINLNMDTEMIDNARNDEIERNMLSEINLEEIYPAFEDQDNSSKLGEAEFDRLAQMTVRNIMYGTQEDYNEDLLDFSLSDMAGLELDTENTQVHTMLSFDHNYNYHEDNRELTVVDVWAVISKKAIESSLSTAVLA
ncbi:uncharacterized protein LOC106658860 [Trichogramma pretiosum]|uniref:uncharacterized protein LOC106658860 n=1 Tax=Trichogramma pretiosum TaxID=7493 RepID=UPI0006C9B31B|nr:uncharacterized protein LOC106658860 [Trichogramma pretiosum]